MKSARYRPGNGGLADTWRSDKAQYLALRAALELTDGYELEYALLDVLHAVVVLVEYGLGGDEVEALRARQTPGQTRQPVEVVARHVELGRVLVEEAELVELLVDDVHDVLGHGERLEAGAELLLDGVLVVLLDAELLLDRLHLLLQHVLAMLLLHLVLHLFADLLLQLAHLELLLEQVEREEQTLGNVHLLEHLLLLARVRVGERRAQVAQVDRVVDNALAALQHERHRLAIDRIERNDVAYGLDDLVGERLDLLRRLVVLVLHVACVHHEYFRSARRRRRRRRRGGGSCFTATASRRCFFTCGACFCCFLGDTLTLESAPQSVLEYLLLYVIARGGRERRRRSGQLVSFEHGAVEADASMAHDDHAHAVAHVLQLVYLRERADRVELVERVHDVVVVAGGGHLSHEDANEGHVEMHLSSDHVHQAFVRNLCGANKCELY